MNRVVSYWDEIVECNVRAARFGLSQPTLPEVPSTKRWLVPEARGSVVSAIERAFAGMAYRDLVAECVRACAMTVEPLVKALECEVFFTLGWIEEARARRFYFDEDDITNWLASPGPFANLNLHAWLTLPSMEILDPSFGTSMAFRSGDESYRGRLIVGHADTLPGFRYRPMLLGTDLPERMGLLVKHGGGT